MNIIYARFPLKVNVTCFSAFSPEFLNRENFTVNFDERLVTSKSTANKNVSQFPAKKVFRISLIANGTLVNNVYLFRLRLSRYDEIRVKRQPGLRINF